MKVFCTLFCIMFVATPAYGDDNEEEPDWSKSKQKL